MGRAASRAPANGMATRRARLEDVTEQHPTNPSLASPIESAQATPAAAMRQRSVGLGVRVLILGWCLWLMGSWVMLYLTGGWNMAAFRVMIFSGLVGLMGVWPAVRLSQATAWRAGEAGHDRVTPALWARACGSVLLDWFCLNLVFQAVIWPLLLAARWTVAQGLWLDAAVAGWSLLTGLIIAWGRGVDRAAWRSLAMVVCVGIVAVEPVLLGLGALASDGTAGVHRMRISPIQAVWSLSGQGPIEPWVLQVVSIWLAALTGWVVLGLLLAVNAGASRKNEAPA